MTPGDFAIITAIKGLTRQKGFPPSVREVAAAVGIKGAGTMLHALRGARERGYIHFEDGRNRSYAVLVEYEGHRPDIIARIGDDALDALVRNALTEQSKRNGNVTRIPTRLRAVK